MVIGEKHKPDSVRAQHLAEEQAEEQTVRTDHRPDVGSLLRQARENHPVRDLDQIARELCIRKHMLAALEDNNFTIFPSACYASGFLKSYATYLGLDATQILAQFRQEFDGASERVELVFPEAPPRREWPLGLMASVATVCLLIVTGVWIWAGEDTKVSSLTEIANVSSTIFASAVAVTDTLHKSVDHDKSVDHETVGREALGPDEKTSAATPILVRNDSNDSNDSVDSAAGIAAGVISKEPARVLAAAVPGGAALADNTQANNIQANNTQADNMPSPDREPASVAPSLRFSLVEQAAAHTSPAEAAQPLAAEGDIRLSAEQDVWVRITGDQGKILMDGVMQAGEAFYVPKRPGLRLMTSNASAVSIYVGGEALSPLGDYGQIVTELALERKKLLQKTAMHAR